MRKTTIWVAFVALVAVASLAMAFEPANTYIIKGTPSNLAASVEAAGGSLLRVHTEIGYATAISDNPDFASNLAGAPGVAGVERDMIVQWTPTFQGELVNVPQEGSPGSNPDGAYFRPCQWNMDQIDAPSAWSDGVFGDGVTVAVLDTGVDPLHLDLGSKVDLSNSTSVLTPGTSLCNAILGLPDEESILDFGFHGTFVSSQITGNGYGMASVASGVEIVAVKVLSCTGSGSFSDIIDGILYAANLPSVDIINMSLGAYFPKSAVGGGQLFAAVTKAVNYANGKGKLVVASAGNGDPDTGIGYNLDKDRNYVHIPSDAGTSVGVYATNYLDELAGYSNYGRSGTWVGAPGGGGALPDEPIPSCVIPYAYQGGVIGACSQYQVVLPFSCGSNSYVIGGTGTSFAAPITAGVAALMDGNYGGALNPGQLKTGLAKTADDLGKKGTDGLYSHGRVNAGNAAQY